VIKKIKDIFCKNEKPNRNLIKIFQIYYNESQRGNLIDGFSPYLNKDKSIFVENQCISNIRHSNLIKNEGYIGTVSHKLHEKVLSKPTLQDITHHISLNPDCDIFSPAIKNWYQPELRQPRPLYHPNQLNMKELALPLLNDMADAGIIKSSSIGLWTKNYDKIIYCNYWIAKKEVFEDYIDSFLDKIIKTIKSYGKDNNIFISNSIGETNSNDITVKDPYPRPPQQWQDATGFSHYPIITFILERLINLYILDRNLNHKAII